MNSFNSFLETANSFLWHNAVLFLVLGTGIVFTLWTRFSQFRSLTHGLHVLRGRYDNPADPGAINHFQALSAALSATVGLGNIGGVALAISLGGPGAVFWMWVVGFFGMAHQDKRGDLRGRFGAGKLLPATCNNQKKCKE